MATDTSKLACSLCFYSVLSYRLIFQGNEQERNIVLNIQKKISGVMAHVKSGVFCRKLFWKFSMFSLASASIFCLLPFVVQNL
jgi:hypothetical protein